MQSTKDSDKERGLGKHRVVLFDDNISPSVCLKFVDFTR